MDTGVPTGMLIQNGRLCVSDGAWNAVGFLSDGSVITGAPGLQMSLTDANGLVRPIYALNKVRTQRGIYLYTSDFSQTTRLTAAGVQVVLDLAPGDYLRLGQPLTGTVSQVVHGTTALTIGENQVILALSDTNTSGTTLGGIEVGQTITINAQTSDTRWHDAVFSCGGGDMLLRNGELTSAATTSKAPRTVLGTRDDGSCVILVCDGRQSGLADGISLRDAALQLQAQGCTNVVNLDGGGSTIIASRLNGNQTVPVLSSPSDGSARRCANFIVFVNGGDQSLPLRPSQSIRKTRSSWPARRSSCPPRASTPTTSPRQRTLKVLPSLQAAVRSMGISLPLRRGWHCDGGRSFRHSSFAGRCVHRL